MKDMTAIIGQLREAEAVALSEHANGQVDFIRAVIKYLETGEPTPVEGVADMRDLIKHLKMYEFGSNLLNGSDHIVARTLRLTRETILQVE